jgi:hypothetical protein
VHHLLLRNHTPPCSHIQMWIVHVPNIFAYSIFTLTDSYKPLNIYTHFNSYLLFLCKPSCLSISLSTQPLSSVQSAWRPHAHPVEYRLNNHTVCFLVKQLHLFIPFEHSQGWSTSRFFTRCLPNVVPPVFCMWRNERTDC